MFATDMPLSQRKDTMLGLREAYNLAQRDGHNPQQRSILRAIEVALMVVTEPLTCCQDLIPDWIHPCLCRECREAGK